MTASGKPGRVGLPLPGVEVTLGPEDEIMVKGPQVSSGYLGATRRRPLRPLPRTASLGLATSARSGVTARSPFAVA